MRGLNKKGAGHFEMIAGFIFFMGFVFFLFLFISPWGETSLPDSALEGLISTFHENVDIPLSSVFVKTEYAGPGNCFYLNLPTELFKKQMIIDERSFVTRLGGEKIDSSISGENLKLSDKEDFFRVAISPEFNQGDVSCDNMNDEFELGGVVELDVVSYSKFVEMRDKYYNDYDGLKEQLRIASIFDFAIVPEGMDEMRMEPDSEVIGGVEVLAKDYVVKILRSDGSISNERVNFRIW